MSSVYGEKDARGKRKGRGSTEYRSIRELARGHPFGQSESTRVMLRNQDVNFIIVNEDGSMGWDVRACVRELWFRSTRQYKHRLLLWHTIRELANNSLP